MRFDEGLEFADNRGCSRQGGSVCLPGGWGNGSHDGVGGDADICREHDGHGPAELLQGSEVSTTSNIPERNHPYRDERKREGDPNRSVDRVQFHSVIVVMQIVRPNAR